MPRPPAIYFGRRSAGQAELDGDPGRTGHPVRPDLGEVRSRRDTNVFSAARRVIVRLIAGGRLQWRALLRAPDIDLVLALAAFVALLVDPLLLHKITELTPVMGVLAFLTAVPLAVRRRFPLGVLAIDLPLLLACLAVFHPNRAAVGITMLLVFTVGLEGGRSRSLVVGALMAPVVTATVFITGTRVGLRCLVGLRKERHRGGHSDNE